MVFAAVSAAQMNIKVSGNFHSRNFHGTPGDH